VGALRCRLAALGFSLGTTTLGPVLACRVAGARSGDTIRVFRSHILVWLTGLLAISRGVTPIDFRLSPPPR